MQLLDWFPAEAAPGLGDPRLASNLNWNARAHQPLHTFEKAAQNLTVGSLSKQCQGDDVVDDYVGWKIPVSDTGLVGPLENLLYALGREHPRHHPEGDVVRDPASAFQPSYRSGHSCARL